MDAASLVKLAVIASVVLLVFATGLAAPVGTLRSAAARPAELGRAALAMFVLFPVAAVFIVLALPLSPTVRLALLALAVSPIAPILPAKQLKLGGKYDYALGIQFVAAAASLVAAPMLLFLWEKVFGRTFTFDMTGVPRMILITIVAPLLAGIATMLLAPALAQRLVKPLHQLGMVLLLGGLAAILLAAGRGILGAASWATLLAILLMSVVALTIGHLLGGPDQGNRHALALATLTRHPGVAIGLAAATDMVSPQSVAPIAFLYLLASIVFSLPYTRLAKAGRI